MLAKDGLGIQQELFLFIFTESVLPGFITVALANPDRG